MSRFNRRAFLKRTGVATTIGMAGLAGCSTGDGSSGGSGGDSSGGSSGGSGSSGGTTTGSGGGSEPVSFTVGHGIASEEQLWLMDAKPDILEHAGDAYEAEFKAFNANTSRFQAFQAGEIQAGTATSITSIFAVNRGLPLTVTASVCQETADGYSTQFMVPPDSDISGLNKDDLQGKKIGICDFKASCDMWAESAAMKVGLEVGQGVQLVKVPFPSMSGAVKNGQVDTATMPHPFDVLAANDFGAEGVFTGVDAVGYDHDLLELWFSTQFISRNTDAVRAFLEDYQRAADYYRENMKEAKQALLDAGFVKTPKDVYLGMSDWERSTQPITDSLGKLNSLAVDLGWIDSKVDIDRLYDLQYLPSN